MYSALNLLSTIPNFQKGFLRFLHKIVGKECLQTARKLADEEDVLSRALLQSYDIAEKYSVLLKESPVLMTALHGASCKQKRTEIDGPSKPAYGGGKRANTNMQPQLLQTAYRLIHTRHPRYKFEFC